MNEKHKKIFKKYRLLGSGVVVIVVALALIIGNTFADKSTAETYREAVVEYGSLVVGIEESGAVDIGTTNQTFELDMSALKRVETSNSSGGGGGAGGNAGFGSPMGGGSGGGMGMSAGGSGNDMFGQIFNMSGGNTVASGSSSSELEIAEVCVSIGQQVEIGDVLYRLEEEGVAELSADLESNVSKAKADLEALIADQNLSKKTAESTYSISKAYGSYAAVERDNSIYNLQQTVAEKEAELAKAQANVASYEAKLEQVQYDYNLAKENLDKCTWSYEHADKEDVYWFAYYFDMMEQASQLESSLSQSLETTQNNLEQAKKNLASCERELDKAKRNLSAGTLSAEQSYEIKMLAYNNAQETYDITLAYLEDSLEEQEEIYEEANEKWEEFSSHIDGTEVKAKYRGIITSVDLAEGDALTTGASIVTLYDITEVSMTVTLEEEDMTDIAIGGMANISFIAYPDTIYEAVISEISDASTDANGNTTYDVTATVQGDASGLFQGMTGSITFITKQMEDVVYVSNRAIIRENNKSYVKVKEENGSIHKEEVVTGFSDGICVEIIEGLEVGDVVLIESKVAGE